MLQRGYTVAHLIIVVIYVLNDGNLWTIIRTDALFFLFLVSLDLCMAAPTCTDYRLLNTVCRRVLKISTSGGPLSL